MMEDKREKWLAGAVVGPARRVVANVECVLNSGRLGRSVNNDAN